MEIENQVRELLKEFLAFKTEEAAGMNEKTACKRLYAGSAGPI